MFHQILVVLSLSSLAQGLYDDEFARSKMIGLAVAAHNINMTSQECLDKTFDGDIQVVHTAYVKCDNTVDTNDCMGYIAVSKKYKAVIISFRGTVSLEQLKEEFLRSMKKQSPIFAPDVTVSEYFYNAHTLFWNGTLGKMAHGLALIHFDYEVWVTGHSLGGALANLFATALVTEKKVSNDRLKLYTFGQPRVGNRHYSNYHNENVKESYRIVHKKDLVPTLPPIILNYIHTKNEIFYFNDMKPKQAYGICAEEDWSKLCQNGNGPFFEVKDHLHYFGYNVETFCTAEIGL